MDWLVRLKSLRDSQKKLQEELEGAVREAEKDNILDELEKLRKSVLEQEKLLAGLKDKLNKSEQERDSLRMSLREQILDEKLSLLKVSREKIELYFRTEMGKANNTLWEMEEAYKQKIISLRKEAVRELSEEAKAFDNELEQFYRVLAEKIKKQKEAALQREKELFNDLKSGLDGLGREEIDEKTIEKRIKQNKLEMKIGLHWLNKIGVVLILIGIGFVATLTYQYINSYMKGIFFFVLGALFLAGGEFFYRRNKEAFALGLIGGATAILYAAVFYSYFSLKIFDMNSGIVLSIIITLTVLVLSVRYNSKTVVSLGLIGGYLPFLTYAFTNGLSGDAITIGMGYLLVLNGSVLALSFWKRWNISNSISFLLNIPCMVYLVFHAPDAAIGIGYTFVIFILYLCSVLIYPFRRKSGLGTVDVVLLALNTTVSTVIIYALFEKAGVTDFRGGLALLFTLIYIGLGYLVDRFISHEKKTVILFYMTALTFAVLMVPFQFGIEWLTMGWLVESVLLIIFGYTRGYVFWERMGWIVFGLCMGAFYLIDCSRKVMELPHVYFEVKFLFITLGQILVFVIYQADILKQMLSAFSQKGKLISYFKYAVIVNFYVYLCYMVLFLYSQWSDKAPNGTKFDDFFIPVIVALISLLVGYVLKILVSIKDKVVQGLEITFSVIADLILLYVLIFQPVLPGLYQTEQVPAVIAFVILIIYNVLAVLNIRELVIRVLKGSGKSLEYYPVWMGVFFLTFITAYLVTQFNLGSWSLLLSFCYLLLAIGSILYGFWKKYLYIRFFGLGLTVFALAKMLFFDLSNLGVWGRTFAVFGFGALLLLLSFVYQKVNTALTAQKK